MMISEPVLIIIGLVGMFVCGIIGILIGGAMGTGHKEDENKELRGLNNVKNNRIIS